MRSSTYGSMAYSFREIPSAVPERPEAYQYSHLTPGTERDRAGARATVLAGFILTGLGLLVLMGLVSLIGVVGLGIARLWS
jgi:hypothetical protein